MHFESYHLPIPLAIAAITPRERVQSPLTSGLRLLLDLVRAL